MAKAISHRAILRSGVQAQEVIARALQDLSAGGYPESHRFAIRLAMDEAINNAIKHGNRGDTAKRVTVVYSLSAELFEVTIEDEGLGFDPDAVPDPTDARYIERPSGRGVMLMRAYMTSVAFEGRGNRVKLVKRRDCPLPAPTTQLAN
jgi:serine/threonine-protein kinase RsbW